MPDNLNTIKIHKCGEFPRLFLYQGPNGYNLDALKKHQVFFTYPSQFNDPYDCDFEIRDDFSDKTSAHGCLERESKKFLLSHFSAGGNDALLGIKLVEPIIEWCKSKINSTELIKVIQERFKNDVGVRCFFRAERDHPESVLMWTHYADNHAGYCVKYVAKSDLPLSPVVYTSCNYPVYLSELLFSLHATSNRILTNKSSIWAHENETRLIRDKPDGSFHLKKGWLERIADIGIDIEAIYLGVAISKEHENDIVNFARENSIDTVMKCVKSFHSSVFGFSRVSLE